MTAEHLWLLPEGIEEVLPPEARRLENLRRKLLDLYDTWGYELVIPPLIEFLDSLLTGTGNDLDLQTFKLTDQLSGRLMGVRADLTPQVARIDAHQLKRRTPTRLCYMGSALRTRSDGFGGTRSPMQIGVELYGHSGYESDLEVLSLMLESLAVTGLHDIHLDLGHVAVFRSLVRLAELDRDQEVVLFDALQRKALSEMRGCLKGLPKAMRDMFLALAELNGGEEVLQEAERHLTNAGKEVQQALKTLRQIAVGVQRRAPKITIHFDLAELRGYHYHTGVLFAAYLPGQGQEVARGGRYDDIGRVFGRARPATGFSSDLKILLALGNFQQNADGSNRFAIYAPDIDDPALDVLVNQLRRGGERVIRALPGADMEPRTLSCDRLLVRQNKTWSVIGVD